MPDYTSYGIKHILQSNTGIYLTNNEFKDAILLCGIRQSIQMNLIGVTVSVIVPQYSIKSHTNSEQQRGVMI